MKRLLFPLTWFLHLLARIVRAIFGDISWQPPGWARACGRRPVFSGGLLLVVIALAAAGASYWNWYSHQPKPTTIDWTISSSPGFGYGNAVPSLTLTFDRDAAKLDQIGQDVTKYVQLSPKLNGEWSWISGTQLLFRPSEGWPAATNYDITLGKELFSRHSRIATLKKAFHTAPFTNTISDFTFYVNPKDPAIKQVTATLRFSYPVDRASLEKNLELAMESGANIFKGAPNVTGRCTVTYDPNERDCVAYIRSVNIDVPKEESSHAILTVPASITTAAGGAKLDTKETAQVLIPATPDLFRFSSAKAQIVTNTKEEPEQALVLVSTVGVKPEVLAKAIHAWIVPAPKAKIDPNTGQNITAWQTAAEITPEILATASPITLIPVPTEQEYATLHSFKLKVPENANVYVTVDKGIDSVGGFTLSDKFSSISQMPPYPRVVKIMHNGSLLALSGERKLSIQSRGVEQIEYRLQRVTPPSINHLVSQSEGNFQSPVFINYNFNETNITEQTIRDVGIAAVDNAKNDFSALDFTEFVKGGDSDGKLGLFILRVLARQAGPDGGFYKPDGSIADASDNYSGDPDQGNRTDILADRRLILVTDLGILVKDNADNTHDVFVQSLKTGEPVEDAKVEVLGKNGIPVATAETDGNGRATLPSLVDFRREKQPVAYVVRQGNDVSFLPFGREDRELNLSRFDVSGVSGLAPTDLTAFVFTDRGIYRPGDTANLGFIVKQRDWKGKLDGIPVRMEVVDPRGTTVGVRTMKLNAGGFLDATYTSRETSPTGRYQVNCFLVKGADDSTLLGSATFRVAEFLPDRMKIKATLSATSAEGWISAHDLTAKVTLENLYGAPSIGHRVKGKLTLNPSQFTFEKYADYSFLDPYLEKNNRSSSSEDLPEQTTNDSGEVTFDLASANRQRSAYQLSFFAEGFEKDGGRSVTAGAEVLVSPRAWLVGCKPDGDFGYVHQNSQRSAKLLAVDSQLKPVAVENLTMKITERRYVSVLVQKPNGNFAYQSVAKIIPVSETKLSLPEKGLEWPLPTAQPGDFQAKLYDEDNALVADIPFAVAGTGNLSRTMDKNAELAAKLSKPEYLPGEEIEVEITAPFTGAGLLTIERDKVYASAWFQAKTTSTVQKIRLPKDFEGNGYLNVAFVRGLDSKEIYMSPLSYTVLPFRVNQEARHTKIDINVPKVAVPGQPLQMVISASRPTQAVVYAVDEGILQVARYTLPDPLAYFFRKQALEVGTRQTVDLILPEYSIVKESAAAGGGEGDDSLGHHLNPFKRKRDKPVAYWSSIVEIGPVAKTFTYDIPDYFAGTIRVMVVANTADAVGSAEKKLQVRGPFIISPNVPTFVAPGDTFEVTSAVANNIEGSGPNAAIKVSLDVSSGLEIVQKPDEAVIIPEGRDTSVHWTLRAKDALGNADITVTAQGLGKKTAMASHLSIRPPVPYLTTLTTGYFKNGEKKVDITRQLYPQFRTAEALISPLPQGLSRGLGKYLDHYDYGCTEQLVSKAFPSLVTDETMQQGLSRAEVAKKVQAIVDVAATRQNDQGAFGYWMVTPDLKFDLPSVWVMQFVTEAREQGYDIPTDLYTRGLDHLQQIADGDAGDFSQARVQAEAVYLLARNGRVVTNALEHNHLWFEKNAKGKWGDDIAGVYEAATYALLKNQAQADTLIKQFHLRDAKLELSWTRGDYDSTLGRASQYIYLLSRHFPERLRSLKPDDIMSLADPIMGGEFNTLSSAQAIMALDSYGRAMKEKFVPGNVEIDQLIGKVAKKLELSPGFYPEGSFARGTDALIFKKTGANPVPGLFYQIAESGFEQTAITTPLSTGIEVSRAYFTKGNPKPVTSCKLGEELTVILRVRSTENQALTNVAIEDLLPGGFEIVEESARTGRCSYGWGEIEYVDVREDRLVAFGTIDGSATTITYRIKATNHGTYVIPPPQAESMYHLKIRARGVTGSLTVAD